ncbi:hypothetical protein U27_04104 [Candidatus Vecturithrix granuli]|uniref:Uncharacterized protein n=1 Tax=Vecturithrix granuli TaxID=1499967 RepID=A0A081BXT4_VECG1|nr:hypothetical protein U27_04104 [Candidatus Vecturithrix granuli]
MNISEKGICLMKKKQKYFRYSEQHLWLQVLGVIVGVLCLHISSAEAIWLGQFQVNPFLELQGIYDTNIFRVSDDQEKDRDFITVISPGIHFEFPTSQDPTFRAVANYRSSIRLYGNDGDSKVDPKGELNTNDHRLDGHLYFTFASGLRFTTGYILSLDSKPPDFRGDTRDGYADHAFLVQTAYAFADRYEIQLGYSGSLRSYDDSCNKDDNYATHQGETTLFYRIFPKLSVLGGGSYALTSREEPVFSDSKQYAGYGGFRYEATEQLTATMKIGALHKDFDARDVDDTTQVYASGETQAVFSDTSSLNVQLYRNIGETSLTDESNVYGAYYVRTGVHARMTYGLPALPNTSFIGDLGYTRETYPEDAKDRSDDSLEIGVGVDYKFLKFFVIGVKYQYSSADSTINTKDFTDHVAMIKIRAIL